MDYKAHASKVDSDNIVRIFTSKLGDTKLETLKQVACIDLDTRKVIWHDEVYVVGPVKHVVDKVLSEAPITVTYDAVKGVAFPDGKAEELALSLTDNITVSTDNVISAIRALCAEDKLDYTKYVFRFQDYRLEMNPDSTLNNWPDGFANAFDDFNMRVLTGMISKAKKKAEK
jgi:hypothetical protein